MRRDVTGSLDLGKLAFEYSRGTAERRCNHPAEPATARRSMGERYNLLASLSPKVLTGRGPSRREDNQEMNGQNRSLRKWG
jgi:hypothetical protein